MLLASSPAINFSMRAFQFSQVSSIVSRSAAVASSASEQHCAHTAEEGCIAPLFFQDEEGTAHACATSSGRRDVPRPLRNCTTDEGRKGPSGPAGRSGSQIAFGGGGQKPRS